MIFEIIKGMSRELRAILKSDFFWLINIIVLSIIILFFIIYLPFNTNYSIEAFQIGPVFVKMLIFGVSSICLYLTEGIRDIPRERVENDSVSKYFLKTLSFVLIITIIIFTYIPLGILLAAIGSLSFRELYYHFSQVLISGISFSWLGLVIKAWFRKSKRRKISAFLKIIWAGIMIISSFAESSKLNIMDISIYICFIFSGFMFAILLYWTYRKKKKDRG